MEMIKEPWEHLIFDDTYDPDMLKVAEDEILTYIKNRPNFKPKITTKTFDPLFVQRFPKTLEMIKASPNNIVDIFKKFSYHRQFTDPFVYSEVNILLDGGDFPIHDEAPYKIMSGVTYLAPEESIGTLLYDADKNFVKEVEWKRNRSLYFCGKDGVTWHSYQAKPGSIRITINTFLADKVLIPKVIPNADR